MTNTQTEERLGVTLREKVIDGVLYERVEDQKAIVKTDENGKLTSRVMKMDELRTIGVKHEGDIFKIHVREYKLEDEVKQETYLTR